MCHEVSLAKKKPDLHKKRGLWTFTEDPLFGTMKEGVQVPLLKPKHNCYCAFCRTPRRIYKRRSIGLLNFISAAAVAVLVMYLFWQNFDPRVLVVFAICLATAETFVQVRWRLSVSCKQCGFDPVLYVKDPEKAAHKVTEHLQRRRQDPKYMLARPLNLPSISPQKAEALKNKEKKGSLVSRQA